MSKTFNNALAKAKRMINKGQYITDVVESITYEYYLTDEESNTLAKKLEKYDPIIPIDKLLKKFENRHN